MTFGSNLQIASIKMWRKLKKGPVLYSGLLALIQDHFTSPDDLKNATKTEQNSFIKEDTGWERVKKIFIVDDFDELSTEAQTIIHVSGMSLFVGAVYGGFNASKVAYMDFMQNNQATKFTDHFEAKKKLQDKVSLSFARGAWKWSWRLGLFCTTFVTATTVIAKYRGKNGLVEYPLGGCFSGVAYKFNAGPRAWIVGGGLGTVLGFIAGCTTVGILKITGLSVEDIQFWNTYIYREKSKCFQQGIDNYMAKEEGALMLEHKTKSGTEASLEKIDPK